MGKEAITVMVCDRCGHRLELRGDPRSAEYRANSSAAMSWQTLRMSDMGGDTEWLLCRDCWRAFINEFMKKVDDA